MGQWLNGSWCGGWMMGGFGMMFGMVLLWVLIIAGGIALFRWLLPNSQRAEKRGADSALEILKQRYAKGEITREEFEQMKKDLL